MIIVTTLFKVKLSTTVRQVVGKFRNSSVLELLSVASSERLYSKASVSKTRTAFNG